MAPLNFPNNPGIGSVYTDSTSGFSYQWNGTVWRSYSAASGSNIIIIDNISGSFNGSSTTFPLTSSGLSITPITSQQLRIVLGGVVQSPGVDYFVSGSNIIFTDPPTAGLSFSGVLLGNAVPITTIPPGTTTQGSLNVAGTLTATSFSGDGSGLTGISGFSTSLSTTPGSFLSNVFVTNKSFVVPAGVTNVISAAADQGNIAFTRLSDITVATGATIQVSTGTTFVLNVLGIFT